MTDPPTHEPADGLLHPVALLAIVVLGLNDQLFKDVWPGMVTGKLSDVAGMIFFPLVLQAAWEVVVARFDTRWKPSRRVLWFSVVATAVVFSIIQLFPWATMAYRHGLGALQWPFFAVWALLSGDVLPPLHVVSVVADPWDCLAVPFVLVAVFVSRRRCPPEAD
jgi:hypothetical protein